MTPSVPSVRPPPSEAARDLAARLFARELGESRDDAALIGAAERLSARIPVGLDRWFGGFGTLALVTRALATLDTSSPPGTQATNSPPGEENPFAARIATLAQSQGARVTADSTIAVMAALTDLLARLIGDDLAQNVLEQSAAASSLPSTAPSHTSTVKKS